MRARLPAPPVWSFLSWSALRRVAISWRERTPLSALAFLAVMVSFPRNFP
jgi:hypothetical protein